MNVIEKQAIIVQFKFQFPMIICALWVISNQWKLIWATLKMWWSWAVNWGEWPSERWNYLQILLVGVVAFTVGIFFRHKREELILKQQIEFQKTAIAEQLTTKEELKQEQKKQEIKYNKFVTEKKREPSSIPFYDISPLFAFLSIVIIAPIVEECVFRYLIFETFGKNNVFPYLFSGLSFIFLHWQGGIFNFNLTTIGYLLLTYLPMTIFFIYAYRKSKWNITYPIYFHIVWNAIFFFSTIFATQRLTS